MNKKTETDIDRITKALDSVPVKVKVTKRALIHQAAPAISGMRAKGYTLQEVVDVLNANGLSISVATLYQYLKKSKQQPQSTKAKKEKK